MFRGFKSEKSMYLKSSKSSKSSKSKKSKSDSADSQKVRRTRLPTRFPAQRRTRRPTNRPTFAPTEKRMRTSSPTTSKTEREATIGPSSFPSVGPTIKVTVGCENNPGSFFFQGEETSCLELESFFTDEALLMCSDSDSAFFENCPISCNPNCKSSKIASSEPTNSPTISASTNPTTDCNENRAPFLFDDEQTSCTELEGFSNIKAISRCSDPIPAYRENCPVTCNPVCTTGSPSASPTATASDRPSVTPSTSPTATPSDIPTVNCADNLDPFDWKSLETSCSELEDFSSKKMITRCTDSDTAYFDNCPVTCNSECGTSSPTYRPSSSPSSSPSFSPSFSPSTIPSSNPTINCDDNPSPFFYKGDETSCSELFGFSTKQVVSKCSNTDTAYKANCPVLCNPACSTAGPTASPTSSCITNEAPFAFNGKENTTCEQLARFGQNKQYNRCNFPGDTAYLVNCPLICNPYCGASIEETHGDDSASPSIMPSKRPSQVPSSSPSASPVVSTGGPTSESRRMSSSPSTSPVVSTGGPTEDSKTTESPTIFITDDDWDPTFFDDDEKNNETSTGELADDDWDIGNFTDFVDHRAIRDPVATPTRKPIENPTTVDPTYYPTEPPTYYPTEGPTYNPTEGPTYYPTENPTGDERGVLEHAAFDLNAGTAADTPTSYPTEYPTLFNVDAPYSWVIGIGGEEPVGLPPGWGHKTFSPGHPLNPGEPIEAVPGEPKTYTPWYPLNPGEPTMRPGFSIRTQPPTRPDEHRLQTSSPSSTPSFVPTSTAPPATTISIKSKSKSAKSNKSGKSTEKRFRQRYNRRQMRSRNRHKMEEDRTKLQKLRDRSKRQKERQRMKRRRKSMRGMQMRQQMRQRRRSDDDPPGGIILWT